MHKEVLHCQELVTQILQYLTSQTDLFNASLVYRTFLSPSQELIWRELHSILPIFKTLSQFQFDEVAKSWHLNGIIGGNDLRSLSKFGRMVREIRCVPTKNQYSIDPSVPLMVALALGGGLLFPRLSTLYLRFQTGTDSPISPSMLPLLYTPHLKSVSLLGSPSAPHAHMFLQKLYSSTSPSHLTSLEPFEVFDIMTLQTIPKFEKLTKLDLVMDQRIAIPFESLVSLSKLEELQYLALTALDIVKYPTWAPVTPFTKLCFRQLTTLRLICPFHAALKVLPFLDCPSLLSFSHWFILPDPGQPLVPDPFQYDWRAFFNAVAECSTSRVVKLLLAPSPSAYYGHGSVQAARQFRNNYAGVAFSTIADAIMRLRLYSLSIQFPMFETLSKGDLKTMGRNWRHLEELTLIKGVKKATRSTDLKLFWKEFPCLHTLSLKVEIQITDSLPLYIFSTHPLKMLTIVLSSGTCSPHKTVSLARWIDTLFPQLTFVEIEVPLVSTGNAGDRLMHVLSELKGSRRHIFNKEEAESSPKLSTGSLHISGSRIDAMSDERQFIY